MAEFQTLNLSIQTKLVSPSSGCSGEFTSNGALMLTLTRNSEGSRKLN